MRWEGSRSEWAPRGQGAYVTDLILGLLDSLEFRCVCHHTEASALVLLKLLLIAHLGDRGRGTGVKTAAMSQERDPDRKSPCRDFHPHPHLKAEASVKKC